MKREPCLGSKGARTFYDTLKIHSPANICSGTLQAIDIGYLVTSKDKRNAGMFGNIDAFELRSNFNFE
jgi:hypothetical protein